MNPIQHPSNNRVIGAPKDWNVSDIDDPKYCSALKVTDIIDKDKIRWMVSFWKPDKVELEALIAGKPVILWVCGVVHPVVSIDVEAK